MTVDVPPETQFLNLPSPLPEYNNATVFPIPEDRILILSDYSRRPFPCLGQAHVTKNNTYLVGLWIICPTNRCELRGEKSRSENGGNRKKRWVTTRSEKGVY